MVELAPDARAYRIDAGPARSVETDPLAPDYLGAARAVRAA